MASSLGTDPVLSAYDCEHPDAKRAVVDVVSLPTCTSPSAPSREPAEIRVLRVREFHLLHVYTCRVDVSADLKPCIGYTFVADGRPVISNLTSPRSVRVTETLTRGGCKKLHEGQPYEGQGLSIVTAANSTVTSSSKNSERTCLLDYDDGTNQYYGVLGIKKVKVTLKDFWVRSTRGSNRVVLPSGEDCAYEDAYCADVPEGEAFWDVVPEDQCGDQHGLDVRYEGSAYLTRNPKDNATHVVYNDTMHNETTSYALGDRTQVNDGITRLRHTLRQDSANMSKSKQGPSTFFSLCAMVLFCLS